MALALDQNLSLLTVQLRQAANLMAQQAEELPNPYFKVNLGDFQLKPSLPYKLAVFSLDFLKIKKFPLIAKDCYKLSQILQQNAKKQEQGK